MHFLCRLITNVEVAIDSFLISKKIEVKGTAVFGSASGCISLSYATLSLFVRQSAGVQQIFKNLNWYVATPAHFRKSSSKSALVSAYWNLLVEWHWNIGISLEYVKY